VSGMFHHRLDYPATKHLTEAKDGERAASPGAEGGASPQGTGGREPEPREAPVPEPQGDGKVP
jgi:hypothetical protein